LLFFAIMASFGNGAILYPNDSKSH